MLAQATPCAAQKNAPAVADFPSELVDFVPYRENPVFAGTGGDTWDAKIRERGWILREGDQYYLWYTGYNDARSDRHLLGYATSPDGLHWTRWPDNPIFTRTWIEDVQVVRDGDAYLMFSEGRHDEHIHALTSKDRIHWEELGPLDIRDTAGKPLSPGHVGTPTVYFENGTWHLFYERDDAGIWLATSKDRKVWTNLQDDPVIACGPESFDRYMVAMNQVLKYHGRYYGYYHALAEKGSKNWTTNVATSTDLIHWQKYPHNPIIDGNKSSPCLVPDGDHFRLYTMHPDVRLYLPRSAAK